MTAAEQTRLSWARRLDRWEDAPAAYLPALRAYADRGIGFQQIVLTPTMEGFLRRINQRLVAWGSDCVVVLEGTRDRVGETAFAFPQVHYVEFAAILLRAWVTLRGRTLDGRDATTSFEFNAVSDGLFAPLIAGVRGAPAGDGDVAFEMAKLDYLMGPSFKLMNFGRRCLRPGDRIVGTYFQPEIREPVFQALARSPTRRVTAAYLLLVTADEVILIRDLGEPERMHRIGYGGSWTYVPRRRGAEMSIAPRPDGRELLSIPLPTGNPLECVLEPHRSTQMEALVGLVAPARDVL
jgi:hypothetical protein